MNDVTPEAPGLTPRNGLAHVSGATDRPLVAATVPAFLADVVGLHGDRPAAVFRATGDRWSYAEFAAKIDALAAGLMVLGVQKGDRVAIWSPNRPEWLLTQFATARIGAILVNINPAYRTHELAYALNKVATSTLLLAPRFKTSDYAGMIRELAPELASCAPGKLRSERLPHLRTVIELTDDPAPGAFGFGQVTAMGGPDAAARLDAVTAQLSPDDPINIQFTSGTTGDPKGATLTHRNIVNNGVSVARAMKLRAGEKLCIPVPFYHCFGMV
ncbi:MAG TPA: AMP-binding protein, partial [Saliniramus sp.]|nr:AMP-binding protein [Saliniramus sp.]